MLEKHPEMDIRKMGTASVVREYKRFYGSKRFSQDKIFPLFQMKKKTFAVFMFNVFLYFEEIFAKMVKNYDKKKGAGIKTIQGVKCQVFSPSNDIFREIFTIAET